MAARSLGSSQRIMARLAAMLEAGQYYEAHQLYRTLHFRWSNAGRHDQLSQLLYEGAITFLKRQQHNSGSDLANLYLDVVRQDPTSIAGTPEAKEQLLQNVTNLYQRIPAQPADQRIEFTSRALKLDCLPPGSVHRQLATVLWKEKNYAESRYHFLHAADDSSADAAMMLVEYQITTGIGSEVDLFIAQFVFQFLCVKKTKSSVDRTFEVYTTNHPSISNSNPPFFLPLLNFIWFLLLAIDTGKSAATFKVLCDLYQPSLDRDPTYHDYLSEIGHLYFGIDNRPVNRRGGFLGNLLQSLFEDDSEHDESSSSAGAAPANNNRNAFAGDQPATSRRVVQDEDLD